MTGSTGSLHAVVPMTRLAIEGALEGWSRINGEGTRTTHFVCAICKTRIHSTNEGRPGLAILRTGSLDDSADVVPVVHMWAKRKHAWIGLPPDAEVYDEAAPIDRLKAIFALNLA